MCVYAFLFFVFFKQKTAYDIRISDWSSDVCSSDLMGELAQACASAGFRHACEAEIDAIGKDDGEQRIAVVGLPARTPMDEAFAEPGPGIDLKQEIGDLHARQSVIGSATGN